LGDPIVGRRSSSESHFFVVNRVYESGEDTPF
jgi:hypothetical protein